MDEIAEVEGRTLRTVSFTVRETTGAEVPEDDPRRYAIEVTAGSPFLTEADLCALWQVVGQALNGYPLPVVSTVP